MSTLADRDRMRRRRQLADALLHIIAADIADHGSMHPNDILDSLATITCMFVGAFSNGDAADIRRACESNAERLARVIAMFQEDRDELIEVLKEYGLGYVAIQ